jgi:hypothetical protein
MSASYSHQMIVTLFLLVAVIFGAPHTSRNAGLSCAALSAAAAFLWFWFNVRPLL